ncbi:MAG: hypothetical protein M0R32_09530 [Candidatus Cloacimonetes bacterium]|jgi:hypothetical protein|nr:hypothetical protein [Candidatus Cloacimonadota bacterium]
MNENIEIPEPFKGDEGSCFCPICGFSIPIALKFKVASDKRCPGCKDGSIDMFIEYGSETHNIYWKEFVETGLLFYGAWIPPPLNEEKK